MIIKLNNKICKDKDEAIGLIQEDKNFDLSITLDNGDEYEVKYRCEDKGNEAEWWLKNGLYHREDGPAITYADQSKVWYKNGKCDRVSKIFKWNSTK